VVCAGGWAGHFTCTAGLVARARGRCVPRAGLCPCAVLVRAALYV
jgi:hypothetical protein